MNSFGCIIIGPSGSGKSTLSRNLSKKMRVIQRDICICNLDPAVDNRQEYQINV